MNEQRRWPCSFNVSIEYSRSNLRRARDGIRLKDGVTSRGRDANGFDRLPCVDVWRTFLLENKCRDTRVDAPRVHVHVTDISPRSTGTRHRSNRATRSRAGPSDVKRVTRRAGCGTRANEQTDERVSREAPAAAASRQTEVESVKYRIQNRATYEIRERLVGCAHDRRVYSPPFIAFCLKLGVLQSERGVP